MSDLFGIIVSLSSECSVRGAKMPLFFYVEMSCLVPALELVQFPGRTPHPVPYYVHQGAPPDSLTTGNQVRGVTND